MWLAYGGGGALIALFLTKAIISEYFAQKQKFVDDLVKKQKGTNHG